MQSRALARPLILPMREVRAVVGLRATLRTFPSEEQVTALGIPAERAAYLVPLMQALRRAPGVRAWLPGPRARTVAEPTR